jgi:hypothetical protein
VRSARLGRELTDYYEFDSGDPDDVSCMGWAQPEIPIAKLPRIRQNKDGIREAAKGILADCSAAEIAEIIVNPKTDRRLVPLLRRAVGRMKEAS